MPATGPTRPLPITDPAELRAALAGQDERERVVLELRYGLADGRQHSLARIGRRLGLSAERVRQLEARALERLGSPANGPRGPDEIRLMAPEGAFESAGTPARQRFLCPWILLLLSLEPAHGSRLKEQLTELGMPTVDYRFLRRLEAEGLLRSTWMPGAAGADRRVYSLTDDGLRQLKQDAEALGNVADVLTAFFERRGRERAG